MRHHTLHCADWSCGCRGLRASYDYTVLAVYTLTVWPLFSASCSALGSVASCKEAALAAVTQSSNVFARRTYIIACTNSSCQSYINEGRRGMAWVALSRSWCYSGQGLAIVYHRCAQHYIRSTCKNELPPSTPDTLAVAVWPLGRCFFQPWFAGSTPPPNLRHLLAPSPAPLFACSPARLVAGLGSGLLRKPFPPTCTYLCTSSTILVLPA